jgi:hypothetical protein
MPRSVVREYWAESRAPRYSLLFALPLLMCYEALAALLTAGHPGGIRNGADVLLQEFFITVFGRYEPVAFAVAVIGPAIWLVARDLKAHPGRLHPWIYAAMLAEAALLAAAFGTVIGTITGSLLHLTHYKLMILAGGPLANSPLATRVMLSLGAGIYEELLFRVILVSSIAFIGRRIFGWRPGIANTAAALVAATVFSAFHYIGPYGDPFRVDSFLFRLLGGLAFSVLYIVRGFGITAWTHALYDLLVLA